VAICIAITDLNKKTDHYVAMLLMVTETTT